MDEELKQVSGVKYKRRVHDAKFKKNALGRLIE